MGFEILIEKNYLDYVAILWHKMKNGEWTVSIGLYEIRIESPENVYEPNK